MTDPHDLLRDDHYIGPLVDEHGELALDPAEDTFERLVVSIIRQQVSMNAAAAIRDRVFDRFEVTPEGIASADPDALQDAGLSAAKADYVKNLADAYLERGYDRAYFADLSEEDVRAELTDVKGIGDWTVDMFLLFCLGREDVFPVGDLGVRKGMESVFDEEMTRGEMRDRAERWSPYRSYASLYLWREQD